MKSQNLNGFTNEQLRERFVELSLQEQEAEYRSDIRAGRRLAKARGAITQILRGRGPDARRVLLPLLDHKNPQVRLNAAKHLLGIERERAVATLKDLEQWGPSAQAGAAGMSLYYLEAGISNPT